MSTPIRFTLPTVPLADGVKASCQFWDTAAANYSIVGCVSLPDPLPPEMEQGARALMVERGPWEARPPMDALRAAPYPKLVISGGWHPAFDAVCDVLVDRLGAGRAVVAGMGHNPQSLGDPFTNVLLAFLRDEAGARG